MNLRPILRPRLSSIDISIWRRQRQTRSWHVWSALAQQKPEAEHRSISFGSVLQRLRHDSSLSCFHALLTLSYSLFIDYISARATLREELGANSASDAFWERTEQAHHVKGEEALSSLSLDTLDLTAFRCEWDIVADEQMQITGIERSPVITFLRVFVARIVYLKLWAAFGTRI